MTFRGLFKKAKEKTHTEILKENFVGTISTEVKLNPTYISLLLFSTIIATLGLLTDSPAVVIGAMLIAPLNWPLIGIATSVITSRRKLGKKSILSFCLSFLFVLTISFLVATITPLEQVTSEINSRISPNLLDLFIALASAVIGVFAVYNPKISESASGVAVSIALLPPLCVTGIGVAFGSWEIFYGSLLLFGANVAAIVFAGALTLYVLGFKPKREQDQVRFSLGLLISSVFIIALAIPLAFYLIDGLKQNEIKSQIVSTLQTQITQDIPESKIENISVQFPTQTTQPIRIQATIFLPQEQVLTEAQQNILADTLSVIADGTIDLQLNLVNSLLLVREQDQNRRELEMQIKTFTIQKFKLFDIDLNPNDLIVNIPDPSKNAPVKIGISFKDDSIPFSLREKEILLADLRDVFETDFVLDIEFIPVKRLEDIDQLARLKNLIETQLNSSFVLISPEISLLKVDLDYTTDDIGSLIVIEATESAVLGIQTLAVTATVIIPQNYSLPQNQIDLLENELTKMTQVETTLTINKLFFERN